MNEIFFMYSTRFSLTSNFNPRCFWEILFFKGMLLKERQEWSSFLVFLLNITSWACLVKSELKLILHWKAQLLIKYLREVVALDWISLTTEKRDVFFFYLGFSFTHSRITELQRKGEDISLTRHYHFHPLHRHLDISRVIATESLPLYIASNRTRTENLWFPSASP